MLTVVVDGNNVTWALRIGGGPAVDEFLQRLEMAAASKDWEVTVIFDGPERYLPRESGLLVVWYGRGKSADSLIERMVYEAADRAQFVVVTEDRAEGDLVRGKGARVWSAQRLLQEMSAEAAD